ncbi:DUF1634 domain-containing protein [Lactobacillus sp. S2-2]|uniref:DUF1634 domain-containing protein n=1 Tax=Lactobacillus sp. S2-2 TaxID=2692917 RepID=UPI001F40F75C|nr:DUF1634 domain-containing protein [Lactobacillus sp. S2-2]MCF6514748.1 DUF1634 domain-containing protein [Lactobacillus sp. S2-2]
MTNNEKKATSQEMEQIETTIGKILRYGVIISSIVMIIGLIMYVIMGSTGYTESFHYNSISELINGIINFKPYAIMMLGLLLLILTPVLRVVVSIYSFYKEKDYLYVYITVFVLIILIISFIIGIEH